MESKRIILAIGEEWLIAIRKSRFYFERYFKVFTSFYSRVFKFFWIIVLNLCC